MSNQPNEAAKALTELCDELEMARAVCSSADYIQLILVAIRDGKVPGIVEAKSLPLIRDEMTAMQAELASLRSALANAEKSLATVTGDCARYHGMFDGATQLLLMARQERDQALAKGAEAEKRADSLQLETNCARNERDSAIDDWGALKSEREALAAQLAEARGLLGDLLAWLTSPKMQTWQYHENGFFAEDAQKFVNRLSLAPPSDRGVEGEK